MSSLRDIKKRYLEVVEIKNGLKSKINATIDENVKNLREEILAKSGRDIYQCIFNLAAYPDQELHEPFKKIKEVANEEASIFFPELWQFISNYMNGFHGKMHKIEMENLARKYRTIEFDDNLVQFSTTPIEFWGEPYADFNKRKLIQNAARLRAMEKNT